MAFKGRVRNWIFLILLVWISVEIVHQVILRLEYVRNGYYKWEEYAFKRNADKLNKISRFFSEYSDQNFVVSYNPNESNISKLPISLQKDVKELRDDLTSGFNFFPPKPSFSLAYNKFPGNKFKISINAGFTFKSDFNGYNFDLIITNTGNPSNSYITYTAIGNEYYLETNDNKKYRHYPIILRYNCDSYDFLISKLFR